MRELKVLWLEVRPASDRTSLYGQTLPYSPLAHGEEVPELALREVAEPLLALLHCELRDLLLRVDDLIDLLLEGSGADEAVDHDVLILPDAVGAVRRLILHSRVPPEVIVDDRRGRREVEPGARGLQREHHDAGLRIVLEAVNHLLTLLH